MSHHTLKKFTWNALEGRMFIEERVFQSFEHALTHLNEAAGSFESFKIYDQAGELVHSGAPAPVEGTYA